MQEAFYGIATLAAIVAATSLALRGLPGIARAVCGHEAASRQDSLDGLRGLLALGVFLHHAVITRLYHGGADWGAPESHFDNLAGRGAVALFFMVSAYLFWGRVLRARGDIDWLAFFRGRIYRLAPMYLAAVAALFALVAIESGFALRVSPPELARQAASWLSFSFLGQPDINGVHDTYTMLSVLWSLRYEWVLYLTLPLFAFLWRRTGSAALIYALVFAISLRGGGYIYFAFFAAGGLAIHLAAWRARDRRVDMAFGAAGLAGLVILCVFYRHAEGYIQTALLLTAFVAALRPWGPWRLLRTRPMRFLGHISYSVYLTHNLMIYALAKWGFGFAAFASLPPFAFHGAMVLLGLGVVAVSTATYLLIEKPFIALAARPVDVPQFDWWRTRHLFGRWS